jgi:hypothetical protein
MIARPVLVEGCVLVWGLHCSCAYGNLSGISLGGTAIPDVLSNDDIYWRHISVLLWLWLSFGCPCPMIWGCYFEICSRRWREICEEIENLWIFHDHSHSHGYIHLGFKLLPLLIVGVSLTVLDIEFWNLTQFDNICRVSILGYVATVLVAPEFTRSVGFPVWRDFSWFVRWLLILWAEIISITQLDGERSFRNVFVLSLFELSVCLYFICVYIIC